MKNSFAIGLIASTFISASALADDLKFWMVTPSNEAAMDAINEIADNFNKKYPGDKIVVEARSIDQHKASLRIAATSDIAPDIFFSWAGYGLGGEYVRSGLSLPMNKYYEEYKWNDTMLPTATAFANQYGGELHGVPYTFRGEALYYNKTLFKKAGIEKLPTTYDELLDAAEKLKKEKIPAITFGGSVNWHLMRLMDVILEAKCGAKTHDELKALNVSWADEACVSDAFNDFYKWTSNYMLKPFMGFDENQSYNLFAAKRAAMMLEGDWLVGSVVASEKLDEVGIFPFPTDTGRLYGFAEYLYVSKKSKNPDRAAAFLDYFTSKDVQQKYLGIISSTSVNKNVVYENQNAINAEWVNIFNNYSQTFANGDQSFPLQITTEYFRIINEVATDSLKANNAGAQFQKFIDNQ